MFCVYRAARLRDARIAVYALASAGCLLAVPALAGKASFNYPPAAAAAFGSATAGAAVVLNNTSAGGPLLTFVLPSDYKPDTTFKVVLYLNTNSSPCVANLEPFNLERRRKGVTPTTGLAGYTAVGGPTVNLPADDVVALKTFKLSPGAGFPGQRPRDSMTVLMVRDSTVPADTCDTVSIMSIDVRYTTK